MLRKGPKKYNLSREDQDTYAVSSFHRAQKAWAEGAFSDEIIRVNIESKKENTMDSALERAGISKERVAIWEFNEAFAAVCFRK